MNFCLMFMYKQLILKMFIYLVQLYVLVCITFGGIKTKLQNKK